MPGGDSTALGVRITRGSSEIRCMSQRRHQHPHSNVYVRELNSRSQSMVQWQCWVENRSAFHKHGVGVPGFLRRRSASCGSKITDRICLGRVDTVATTYFHEACRTGFSAHRLVLCDIARKDCEITSGNVKCCKLAMGFEASVRVMPP